MGHRVPPGFRLEDVKNHERRRLFLGKHPHAAGRRVQAHLKIGKRIAGLACDQELAIQNKAVDGDRLERAHDVGEIPLQRLSRFRPQTDVLVTLVREAPESIPLRFIAPFPPLRQSTDEQRLHREDFFSCGHATQSFLRRHSATVVWARWSGRADDRSVSGPPSCRIGCRCSGSGALAIQAGPRQAYPAVPVMNSRRYW